MSQRAPLLSYESVFRERSGSGNGGAFLKSLFGKKGKKEKIE